MPQLIETVNQEPIVFGGILSTHGAVAVYMQRTGGYSARCIDRFAFGSTTVDESGQRASADELWRIFEEHADRTAQCHELTTKSA